MQGRKTVVTDFRIIFGRADLLNKSCLINENEKKTKKTLSPTISITEGGEGYIFGLATRHRYYFGDRFVGNSK